MVGSKYHHHTGLLVPEQQVTEAVPTPDEAKQTRKQKKHPELEKEWGGGGRP